MPWPDLMTELLTFLSEPLFHADHGGPYGPSIAQLAGGLFWCLAAFGSWHFVRWRTKAADIEGAPVLLRVSALALRIVAAVLCSLLALDVGGILPAELVLERGDALLNGRLTHLGNRDIALSDILVLIVVVAVTFWGTGVVTKITLRALGERGVDTSGTVGVLLSLGRYVLIVVGLGVALNTIGIDLTALFTLGAVFAVTIGFALQNISQNFISGIILLVEGAIRPGDILEVEGRVVRVIKLGVRSTVARSMDDEDLILPNATLAQGTVKNLTMIDDELRIRASVSVAYESDLEQIEKILMTAARSVADPKAIRTPIVLLEEFADSGIHFDAFIWISDPWMAPKMRSKLRMAIWKAFKAHGVVIPFPQVDVHVERPGEVQH